MPKSDNSELSEPIPTGETAAGRRTQAHARTPDNARTLRGGTMQARHDIGPRQRIALPLSAHSHMDNQNNSAEGLSHLAVAILVQAFRDSWRGDRTARAWLILDGELWADALGYEGDIYDWARLAERPQNKHLEATT